jgi:Integral membrane protein CcmA involved in cell shape determination
MSKNETVPQINDVSRISIGTHVKGILVSKSDIRIDGVFDGDIVTSGKLVLGEESVVTGRIFCSSADIWGKVSGQIVTQDLITLRSNSSFKGEMKVSRIGIEVGAVFSGNCDIISEKMFNDIWKNLQINDFKDISFANLPESPHN